MGKILPEISRVYSEFLLQPTKVDAGFEAKDVDLSAPIAKFKYDPEKKWKDQTPHMLKVGFMTAAMQAVSGDDLAIETAKRGFPTTIFCSQEIDSQAEMIRRTKRVKGGFVSPYVISPDMLIGEVISASQKEGHGKYPVTVDGRPNGKVVGLLTEDLYDERHKGLKVADRMIRYLSDGEDGWNHDRLQRYVAFKDEVNGDLSKANELMRERARSRIVLIVDKDYNLDSAVFRKDVEEHNKHSKTELVDGQHRYKVAAGVNTKDYEKRVPAVLDAGADWLVVDASQGHSDYQAEILQWIRKKYGHDVIIISGNYVTPEGFDFAVAHDADAVKNGIGPGSICTTRVRFGGGAGQATAVARTAKRRNEYFAETGIYVPIIADGGIVSTSNIITAYALESDIVMMGRFFAGYHESPTAVEYIDVESKDGMKFLVPAKPYWGEASEKAKKWRMNRGYETLEGIEGYVPYKGRFGDTFPLELADLVGGIQKFGYKGIKDLNDRAQLLLQSEGSVSEGKPHDIYRKK